jgi:hypothetical protein
MHLNVGMNLMANVYGQPWDQQYLPFGGGVEFSKLLWMKASQFQ